MTNVTEAQAVTFSDLENDICMTSNAAGVALDFIGDILSRQVTAGKMFKREADQALFLLHSASESADEAREKFYVAHANAQRAFGREVAA